MTITIGGSHDVLDQAEVETFIASRMAALDLDGRSLCLVIPDATRSCPLPLLLAAIHTAVAGRVSSCVAVVALGTHAPMEPDALQLLVGSDALKVVNHTWWKDDTFVHVGSLTASTVSRLSGNRIAEDVDVRVNRLVVESDVTVIVGPVLPHEVVGFSGGDKYLFPGLSGPELIDVTHWLGALITSRDIIGTQGVTPVRALIHGAAALVHGERHALCVVVDQKSDAVHSMSFGRPADAWAAAAAVASETHVTYLPAPVRRVLSVISPRYSDLWTGAKGFYKVEPIVADGGEVVLFAPHITEIAAMHPDIADLGYHSRDYFLAHWEPLPALCPGGPRSLHAPVRCWDLRHHARRTPTSARQIGHRDPRDVVLGANLEYLDRTEVDPEAWAADPDTLVVPDAGEVLYRLRP